MSWTPPVTFTDGTVVQAADLNTCFTSLSTKFNAGIASGDMNAAAGVSNAQLANKYEHMDVQLRYGDGYTAPAGWPAANTKVAFAGVPGISGVGVALWVVTEINWLCTDTGAGAGAFEILWGGYTGNPAAWNTVTTVKAATTIANGAGAATGNNVAATGLAVSLTQQAYPCWLCLSSTAIDAAACTNATDQLVVTVRLRRELSST